MYQRARGVQWFEYSRKSIKTCFCLSTRRAMSCKETKRMFTRQLPQESGFFAMRRRRAPGKSPGGGTGGIG